MDLALSSLAVVFFQIVGFLATMLLVTRWLLKEIGKFSRFYRRWKTKYFPAADRPA